MRRRGTGRLPGLRAIGTLYGNTIYGKDYFEIVGGYSSGFAIYNASMDSNYDYDIFRIDALPGQSIEFTRIAGNINWMNGMSLRLCMRYRQGTTYWDNTNLHEFPSGGETFTIPTLPGSQTFIETYLMISIPSGITGSAYDFRFRVR